MDDFDIHNIRNDFFMLIETKEIALVVGGNQMDFFSKYERLDDASLRELSNQWMLAFLKYNLKRILPIAIVLVFFVVIAVIVVVNTSQGEKEEENH